MKGGFTSSFQQAAHKKLCEQPFKKGIQEQFFQNFLNLRIFAKFALFLVKTRSYSFIGIEILTLFEDLIFFCFFHYKGKKPLWKKT